MLLELILLSIFAISIGRIAKKKGHNPWRYYFLTFGLCIAGDILGYMFASKLNDTVDIPLCGMIFMRLQAAQLTGFFLGTALAYTIAIRLKPLSPASRPDSLQAGPEAQDQRWFIPMVLAYYQGLGYSLDSQLPEEGGRYTDLYLSQNEQKRWIRCIPDRRSIEAGEVASFGAARAGEADSQAGIVAIGAFTEQAQALARDLSIELVDGPQFLERYKAAKWVPNIR